MSRCKVVGVGCLGRPETVRQVCGAIFAQMNHERFLPETTPADPAPRHCASICINGSDGVTLRMRLKPGAAEKETVRQPRPALKLVAI